MPKFWPATVKAIKTFLGLIDTPASYDGQAGKVPTVNAGEDALEFAAPKGWELIKHATFADSIDITDLHGDTDKLWLLIIKWGYADPGRQLKIRFNGDNGGNYDYARHWFGYWGGVTQHESDAVTGATQFTLTNQAHNLLMARMLIYANGRDERALIGYGGGTQVYPDPCNTSFNGHWNNFNDELIAINLTQGDLLGGEYWLFKIKT